MGAQTTKNVGTLLPITDTFQPTNDLSTVPPKSPLTGFNQAPTDYSQPLSQGNLLPGQRDLDPYTQSLISDIYSRATDPNQIAQQEKFVSQGFDNNPLSNTKDVVGSEASTMGQGTLAEAIGRKYQRDYNQNLTALKNQFQSEAPVRAINRLSPALSDYTKLQQLHLKNYQEQVAYFNRQQDIQRQYELARAQAQSSFLSSVLGVLGTVGGALIAGPVGAAVGGAAAAGTGAVSGVLGGANVGAGNF